MEVWCSPASTKRTFTTAFAWRPRHRSALGGDHGDECGTEAHRTALDSHSSPPSPSGGEIGRGKWPGRPRGGGAPWRWPRGSPERRGGGAGAGARGGGGGG